MRVISLLNQKGGSAKTTTAINLGFALHKQGKKVLLVDLDAQANLTAGLGIKPHTLDITIYHMLKQNSGISQEKFYNDSKNAIIDRDGLSIVPASIHLSGIDLELSGATRREYLLGNVLQQIIEATGLFDYVLLDCPPSLGLMSMNALVASNEIIIPVQAEYFALYGVSNLLGFIQGVQDKLNPNLKLTGAVATLFDKRKNLNQDVVDALGNHFGDKIFKTKIRNAVALAEAPGFGQTIFEYSPQSNGAKDYSNLCSEVINQ